MNSRILRSSLVLLTAITIGTATRSEAADASAASISAPPVQVRMTVTASVANGKRLPRIEKEDVVVKRGKERLTVTDWVPARGASAGLDLFILIDDSSRAALGLQFEDLRRFINQQPATTSVGIGYNRNGMVQIVQNPTNDHAKAAQALRLPLGSTGAYGNPYLAVSDLMNRWPQSGNRREIVMITDGLDRPQRHASRRALTVNPYVDTAAAAAQRTGTIIHTIYSPGDGRVRGNYWQARSAQLSMTTLSDKTGGQSFYLGLQDPISFKPYLEKLQTILDSQYLLTFSTVPSAKSKLQYVGLSTEVAGVQLKTHDAVWVPTRNN